MVKILLHPHFPNEDMSSHPKERKQEKNAQFYFIQDSFVKRSFFDHHWGKETVIIIQ